MRWRLCKKTSRHRDFSWTNMHRYVMLARLSICALSIYRMPKVAEKQKIYMFYCIFSYLLISTASL